MKPINKSNRKRNEIIISKVPDDEIKYKQLLIVRNIRLVKYVINKWSLFHNWSDQDKQYYLCECLYPISNHIMTLSYDKLKNINLSSYIYHSTERTLIKLIKNPINKIEFNFDEIEIIDNESDYLLNSYLNNIIKSCLTPREQCILLSNENFDYIALELGLSRERVRQIYYKSIERIRKHIFNSPAEKLLKSYL